MIPIKMPYPKEISIIGLAFAILVVGTAHLHGQSVFGSSASQSDINVLTLDYANGDVEMVGTNDAEIRNGLDNQGWWSPTRANTASNTNYLTGVSNGYDFNSFFVFALGNAYDPDAQVVSATLSFVDPGNSGIPPAADLSIWDVTTPIDTLVDTVGTSQTIYNDLGSGILYGSTVVGASSTQNIQVNLDAAAIDAINNEFVGITQGDSDYFAFGASLTPAVSTPDSSSTAILLALGALALAWKRRMDARPTGA